MGMGALSHLLKVEMDAGNVRFEGLGVFFPPSFLRICFSPFSPVTIETSIEAVALL